MQDKLKELLAIRDGNLSMKEARKFGIAKNYCTKIGE